MAKLKDDKKYRVYDFSGVRYLLIILLCVCGCAGCAGTQKAVVTMTDDGAIYTQDEAGIMEFEFYESGAIKRVKSDSKKEPFSPFRGLLQKLEVSE